MHLSNTSTSALDIAIVGMSGRFPGAESVARLWSRLREGAEGFERLTDDDVRHAGVSETISARPDYVKVAGSIAGIEGFDAAFFEYSPREAQLMDPQLRVLHECVWEALEDAGHPPTDTRAAIGLYAAVSNNAYWLSRVMGFVEASGSRFQAVLLNDLNFANHISYKLDLRGPSLAIQTACSSSLVAIHLACQALLSGECDLALAGGASVAVPQRAGYLFQEGMIHSPDGHCRPFDARAAGTVFANGAGIVALKRLDEALADGDHVYAVIRGSAINNDGRRKAGYTAPSTHGQAQVIRAALTVAGVAPQSISYVEAHGTGTPLGDPIEIEALTEAFRPPPGAALSGARAEPSRRPGWCAIGSVKSNIGHLDAAAGITGLIKVALSLTHREIPATLHYVEPNPKIDFSSSPFRVVHELTPWSSGPLPRRAGVSSFGIGGTNAHVILEEAPPIERAVGAAAPAHLLLLSGKTESAVAAAAERLRSHLASHRDLSLADVAYTLQVGRVHFRKRRALMCRTIAEAIEGLREPATISDAPDQPPAHAWIFPGEGVGYDDLVGELYALAPQVRASVDRWLARVPSTKERPDLALFAFEHALAEFLEHLGLEPGAMLGSGVGEYVAACRAGVFAVEDAPKLLDARRRALAEGASAGRATLEQAFRDVRLRAPGRRYFSSVTGDVAGEEVTTATYWARQLREPTHLATARLRRDAPLVVELTSALAGWEGVLTALGQLWAGGASVRWDELPRGSHGCRVSLPTYPFERKRFWAVMDGKREDVTAPAAHEGPLVDAAPPPAAAAPAREGDQEDILGHVRDCITSYFGLDHIDLDENFFEVGASSFDLTQIAAGLSERLKEPVHVTNLYTNPSVRLLAKALGGQRGGESLRSTTPTPAHPAHRPEARLRSRPAGAAHDPNDESVAVIGMSCRFPGAQGISALWDNLRRGRETISQFTPDELLEAGVLTEQLEDGAYRPVKGIIEGVESFDADFFGYAAKEAAVMDPQFRILHECAWEALEDAGYDPERYEGLIGVFCGTSPNLNWLTRLGRRLVGPEHFATMLVNDREFFSTALSYKLNLRGPSVTTQTACSTSLVNIVLASQSLLGRASDIALAGGVTVSTPLKAGYVHQEGMIYSPDGHCRPFDASAAGTVFGDGAGLVVLKRLVDALDDGDHVYAVIRGSALNNDGRRKVGYTAPSTHGQAQVIRSALAMARVPAESVTYVEAHGTATPMGDPIEVEALKAAFGTRERGFCGLGSVKSNFGHLNAAAGVAGFIKTVLALEHKEIPPTLHFTEPNPKIDFGSSPFYVVDRLTAWKTERLPRRAGVSSFGIGGTNAHVILEEPPALADEGQSSYPAQVVILSGKTATAVTSMSERLREHLRAHPESSLQDVAHTLQVGRAEFRHRRVVTCRTVAEAIAELGSGAPPVEAEEQAPGQVWLFPGQGSQYANMARGLFELEPHFRATMTSCFELASKLGRADLRQLVFPPEGQAPSEALQETEHGQPALFAVEYALSDLLSHWGQKPRGMFGHSLGEFVAACLAGVLSLEDAMRLVIARGRVMQKTAPGTMLGVAMSWESLRGRLGRGLSLAANNAPEQCTVSGAIGAVQALEAELQSAGVKCRVLKTNQAFHSELMDPVLGEFGEVVRSVRLNAPEGRYVSSLTGDWVGDEVTKVDYWVRQLREPVQASAALRRLLEDAHSVLVEAGPGGTLGSFARQVAGRGQRRVIVNLLRHPQEEKGDWLHLLAQLGRLWQQGVSIPWELVTVNERVRRRVPLPTYPFERKRFWEDASESLDAGLTSRRKGQVADRKPMEDWFYAYSWERAAEPSRRASQALRYLLFDDPMGLARELADRLKASGHHVDEVSAGTAFARLDDQRYAIDPRSKADHERLLRELHDAGRTPDAIVHLRMVTPRADVDVRNALDEGYYSLIHVAQALEPLRLASRIALFVVGNHLVDVLGGEDTCVPKSTVLGPAKVIPQEHTNLRTKIFDVDVGQDLSRVAARLAREISSESPEHFVAYRRAHRWIQLLKPIALAPAAAPLLRDEGSYIILGGFGGIGRTLARYLARHHRAKLTLTARAPLPARSEWDRWCAEHRKNDPVRERIEFVRELESLHARVHVATVNINDERAMRRLLEDAEREHGPIHGVVHSAGLPDGDTFRAVQQIRLGEDEQQFEAKVFGLDVLQTVLGDRRMDFCMLFSSVASVLGGLGFSSYTAANQYLDARAEERNRRSGTRWICINWDVWDFGHAGSGSNLGTSLMASAIRAFEEGDAIFARLFGSELPDQVFVSTTDLRERMDTWIHMRGKAERADGGTATFARPDLPTAYVDPGSAIEQQLADVWREFLKLERVGAHDNFFDLGASSLDAVRISELVKQKLGRALSVVDIFTYPTISQMAAFLNDASPSEQQGPEESDEPARARDRSAARRLRRAPDDDDG